LVFGDSHFVSEGEEYGTNGITEIKEMAAEMREEAKKK
jgi:hypothetical protein